MPEDNSEILAALVEEFTQRLRDGDEPTIADYVERHPELEAEIRKVFPSIRAMEQLSSREQSERTFERKTRRLMLAPDGLLGDFRIIREIGRGGMGVVYEAEQQSLKRHVALKILGPTMANSPRQLARFRSEAKAVAQLHHTNIVSVYGVGEHEGLYFYAMQLIQGLTVSEAIALDEGRDNDTFVGSIDRNRAALTKTYVSRKPNTDDIGDGSTVTDQPPVVNTSNATPKHLSDINKPLHSPNRWVEIARLGACVADALDYAHSNGVWHRDIKPSNLIIDGNGVVWITDFGLARHEDRDDVTASGDIVGTLRYMAPEQFSGQFDGRCDTYSLGMTIYEMLALRPAFIEPRHGPLIKQKTTSRPPAPRTLNPNIPRDLETIVLKACSINPDRRYARPSELADDLRRFIEDRPILARRVTVRERLYRWARRNPLPAALSILTMLSLTSAFIVFGKLTLDLQVEAAKLEAEKRKTNVERLRAETTSKSLEVVADYMYDTQQEQRVSIERRGLPDSLELELGRASKHQITDSDSQRLLLYVDRNASFVGEYTQRAGVGGIAAQKQADNGEIHEQLWQLDEALQDYLAALKEFQLLSRNDRKSIPFVTNQARMHAAIGRIRALTSPDSLSAETRTLLARYDESNPTSNGASNAVEFLIRFPDSELLRKGSGLKYDPAKFELARSRHTQHVVSMIANGYQRFIGATLKVDPERWGTEIEHVEDGLRKLKPLRTRKKTEYALMNAYLETDRAQLALLQGDDATARLHFSNAVTVLGGLLTPGFQPDQQLHSDAIRLLRLELAYVLVLANELELNSVRNSEAIASLKLLAETMDDLAAKERNASQAAFIAESARERIRDFESE